MYIIEPVPRLEEEYIEIRNICMKETIERIYEGRGFARRKEGIVPTACTLCRLYFLRSLEIGIALWFGLIGCRRYDSNMLNKLAYHCTTCTNFKAMSNRYPSIYLYILNVAI